MLSKKTSSAGKVAPSWRPNFRNVETLPDISAVRVKFFVNLAAAILVVTLIGVNAQREYAAWSLQKETTDLSAQVQEGTAANRQILKQNETFTGLAEHATELNDFITVPVLADELIMALAENKPDNLILEGVRLGFRVEKINKKKSLRIPTVTISGTISGSSQEATEAFVAYKQMIAELPLFAERVSSMRELPQRDEELKITTFQLDLELKEGEQS